MTFNLILLFFPLYEIKKKVLNQIRDHLPKLAIQLSRIS